VGPEAARPQLGSPDGTGIQGPFLERFLPAGTLRRQMAVLDEELELIHGDTPCLMLADVLGQFPVALLERMAK